MITLTFDNLGEVADLERGRWPADAPLGRHASVTRTLPRILALLFHPFLLEDEERFDVLRWAVERIRESGRRCVPCREV